MDMAQFREMPAPPHDITPGAVVARLVDGLAFRYYWATEGLHAEDEAFRCCEGSMTVLEVMQHIWRVTSFARHCATAGSPPPGDPPVEMDAVRRETLAALHAMRGTFLEMSGDDLAMIQIRRKNMDETFPFWNLISGPLADALTHVGQINSWRRANGNPARKINFLIGKPA